MLLVLVAACLSVCGSSAVRHESECEGGTLRLPFEYTPPYFRGQLFFTPNKGGPRRLMMDGDKMMDPRLVLSYSILRLNDLTRRDDGTFSVSFDDYRREDVIRLTIEDCANRVAKYHGDIYYCSIPRKAEFLEFTPSQNMDKSYVVWNRSNSQVHEEGKGKVRGTTWEMSDLTQADSGYYTFRKRDKAFLSQIFLSVTENTRHFDVKVGERLHFQRRSWAVIFTAKGQEKRQNLVEAYNLVSDDRMMEPVDFSERLKTHYGIIIIDPVEVTDSGTFEFRDQNDNLAMIATVEVEPEFGAFVYVLPIVGIIAMVIFCCCCVRKCCCKKSPPKRESAPQSAPAPAVSYSGENRPPGPSYRTAPPTSAFSYQPVKPHVPTEPTSAFAGPPTAASGGQGTAPAPSLGSDWLSSGIEPTFHLKGLTFPSAPPLSSDSTVPDVYNSDKLNFM